MTGNEPQQDSLVARQYREYIIQHGRQTWSWESIPIGAASEMSWERTFTVDTSMWYADTVEDYSGWYEAGVAVALEDRKGTDHESVIDSPFGGPVVPPMLVRYWASAEHFRRLNIFGGVMMITFHDTRVVKPVLAGTKLRYTARIVRKFEKRGRFYCGSEFVVVDAATGELVLQDYMERIMGYRKASA